LIYGSYFYHQDPYKMISSLIDHVGRERIECDMLHVEGPDFYQIDKRLLSLYLVEKQMTNALLFDPEGEMVQPSELLYKKNIIVLRGSFRPPTHVNMDMLHIGLERFTKDLSRKNPQESKNIISLNEITLNNLSSDGNIDHSDFLSRVDLLGNLGQYVMISNYSEYYRLISYLTRFTKKQIGVILGGKSLQYIFQEKYYKDLTGGILEAFGILFAKNIKLYVYPFLNSDNELTTSNNLEINQSLKYLYQHLLSSHFLQDLKGYHTDYLHIYSKEVIKMIQEGNLEWKKNVPEEIAKIIQSKKLFGCE